MRRLVFGLCLSGLIGCTSGESTESPTPEATPTATPAPTVVDLRLPVPAMPEGGLQFVTPDITIPAGSDKQFCYVTTYKGPDVAINAAKHYQSEGGHHVILLGTSLSTEEYPDGTLFDCTTANSMKDAEPIYVGGEDIELTNGEDKYFLQYPDPGMATKLNSGTRIFVQAHYINTLSKPTLVRDVVNLYLVPIASVTEWVAPFSFVSVDFSIPALSEYEVVVDCTWTDDLPTKLLYMGGHLHEWGKYFYIDYIPSGESKGTRVYGVDNWLAEYRDKPIVNRYGTYYDGPDFVVNKGDRFITTCGWYNDTDVALEFPNEMCATFGSYYSAKTPWICAPN